MPGKLPSWIYYNTGMRVLITTADGSVVVDSSEENSLVGQVIESAAGHANGEVTSFNLALAGKSGGHFGSLEDRRSWRSGHAGS